MLVKDIEIVIEPRIYEMDFEVINRYDIVLDACQLRIFDFDLSSFIVPGDNCQAEKYKGPYDITPAISSQVMDTKNKHMTDNVLVEAVPYFETANDSGHTVYIANNIGD